MLVRGSETWITPVGHVAATLFGRLKAEKCDDVCMHEEVEGKRGVTG